MIEGFKSPPGIVKRNGLILVVTIVATFAVLRLALQASPDSDFSVGG